MSRKNKNAPDLLAVFRALGDQRMEVVGRFRNAGGDLDRWKASDWLLMASELTRLEDALEGGRSRSAIDGAAELKTVRRSLEDAANR